MWRVSAAIYNLNEVKSAGRPHRIVSIADAMIDATDIGLRRFLRGRLAIAPTCFCVRHTWDDKGAA
jgi:hypothetical protein